jgi:uncharacterized protein (UPF0333 family)
MPYAYLSSGAGVVYTVQNTNLTGLGLQQNSIYNLYSTDGTNLTVTETINTSITMSCVALDTADERICNLLFFENGTLVNFSSNGISIAEAGTNESSICFQMAYPLVPGRNYTWRFTSANGGTADLALFKVFIMRI